MPSMSRQSDIAAMLRGLCAASSLAMAGLCLASPPVAANANWQQSSSIWKTLDKCTHAAQKAFPDYTRESNAKREAFRRKCLRGANLPAGDDPPQPSPQQR
jgi:hypothetical protein